MKFSTHQLDSRAETTTQDQGGYLKHDIELYKRINNQRTDSPESRLEGNGLEVFTLFCSNLSKAFKIQNNLTIRQYYMQAYF